MLDLLWSLPSQQDLKAKTDELQGLEGDLILLVGGLDTLHRIVLKLSTDRKISHPFTSYAQCMKREDETQMKASRRKNTTAKQTEAR